MSAAPRPDPDPKTGRFIAGNRLGRGRSREIPRAVLHASYRQALERACTPQDLYEITRRAVADAKRGDADARGFIAKILGLGSLRIIVDPHPDSMPVPVYHLDALDDGELA